MTFTEAKDGADDIEFSRRIYEIYGHIPGLAEKIISAGGILPEGERQVPDVNGYEEMVQQYLNYFFEGRPLPY